MLVRQSLTKCLIALAIAGVWATTVALSWKDTASQEAEQAKRLYGENKLDEALAKITSAQVGMPDSLELQYNMGNVLYRKGNFEDATAGYKVASQDAPAKLAQCATYNMGNASFKAGNLEAAIDAYTQALLLNPNDDEARFNLEIALRTQQAQDKQKQEQQKEDQQKENKDKQDQEQQQENSQDKSEKGQEENQQKQDEQQQQESQGQQQDAEQQEGKDEQGQQGEQEEQQPLTKDQIEQILAALSQQEEQVEKTLQTTKKVGASSVEKDW